MLSGFLEGNDFNDYEIKCLNGFKKMEKAHNWSKKDRVRM